MTPQIKSSLMSVTRSQSFGRFVELLERLTDRHASLLRVLTYHRVDEPAARPDLYPGTISATPGVFAQQMEHLASRYHVASMAEVLSAVRGKGELPPRSVLITFDDAYHDFALDAWPVLRHHGLPATLFVPTAYPNGGSRPFWWDRLYHAVWRPGAGECLTTPLGPLMLTNRHERNLAVRRLLAYLKTLPHRQLEQVIDDVCGQQNASSPSGSVLSWERLRALAAEGLTLAAHSQTHPLLSRVTLDEARREVRGSRDDLVREIGETPPVFAYPGGAFTGEVVAMLRSEGFELAFTTCRGINDLRRADPLRLRRINVGRHTTASLWRAQLVAAARHGNFCWPMPAACCPLRAARRPSGRGIRTAR
ncbi:MAG: hypothetical protein A2V98_01625 [Planctomycetes bacterium RBG_16_64_12]|nr:MAG: hypothetical protein A2V98_01625 [Planctomycetes bacterium RBG_16_64_12]